MSSTRTPTTERLAIGHPTQEMLPQRKEKGKPNHVFLRGLPIFCEMPRRGKLQCDSARSRVGSVKPSGTEQESSVGDCGCQASAKESPGQGGS